MSFSGFRGGRHPWRRSSASQPQQGPIRTPPTPPLGTLLQKLTPEQCTKDEHDVQKNVGITNAEFIASYNWTDAQDPTILFPGMPAVWDPPPEAKKLPQDSGRYFKDPNAARHPNHPMEPAAKAVLAQNPDLDTASIDVFGCTSTLGSLLRFLKKDDKLFRFTVEAVGNTVFFVRRENAPHELIAGPRGFGPTGHGHVFPDRYTRWRKDVKGSASHQRIISYQFGGLRCLVRFEADGYLEEQMVQEEGAEEAAAGDNTAEHAKTTPEIDNIITRAGGQLIPQHTIFELKTRGTHKKDIEQMSEHLPRMWTAQIPFFILAFHEYGLFKPEDITIHDVREKVAAWQDENQKLLHEFSVLLEKLASIACDPAIGKYEVCVQQQGILEIRKQGGTVSSPLPSPLTWVWADQDDSDTGSSSHRVSVDAGASDAEASDDDAAAHSDGDDAEFTEDFTACSATCDYCGRCSYKLR